MMIDDDDDMEVEGEENEPDDDANGDVEKDEKGKDEKDEKDKGEKPKRYKPPTEAEYKALQDKLERAERQAERREKLLRERQKDAAKGKDEKGKDDEKPTGPSEREKALETTAIRSAGHAAFRDAGFEGTGEASKDRQALNRLVQLIDTSELQLNERTGEVDGLDDQVAEIKDQFPGLFKQSQGRGRRGPVPRVTRGGRESPEKRDTADQILVKRLTGQTD